MTNNKQEHIFNQDFNLKEWLWNVRKAEENAQLVQDIETLSLKEFNAKREAHFNSWNTDKDKSFKPFSLQGIGAFKKKCVDRYNEHREYIKKTINQLKALIDIDIDGSKAVEKRFSKEPVDEFVPLISPEAFKK